MNEHEVNILRAVLGGYHPQGWDHWYVGASLDVPTIGRVTVASHSEGNTDGLPTVLIFQLERNGETLFFRKAGYTDSYEFGVSWTGEFRQVKPVERLVYDYV